MSLISVDDTAIRKIAQKIYDHHFAVDPELDRTYDERSKQLMYQDILYNLQYLHIAVIMEDELLFSRYAVWLYELLIRLMKHVDRDRLKDHMILHYQILSDYMIPLFEEEQLPMAQKYLEDAIEATRKQASEGVIFSERFHMGPYAEIRKKYLDALLQSDTQRALKTISDASVAGIPLVDIYEEILQETMHEVGELWHKHIISIDKEHYCTSTTQRAISQFYQQIFTQKRIGRCMLACCIGGELHEMGGRMLSDIFEYHGWDTIYLGAAVPLPSIIHAIEEENPHLVSLSVTMPHFLPECRQVVQKIRDISPQVKIAVGGHAFEITDKLWEKWNVDIYTKKASDLVKWANTQIYSE